MFLKYKSRRAIKKITNGASANEIKKAVSSVVKEASRQLSRRVGKVNYRIPLKVTSTR